MQQQDGYWLTVCFTWVFLFTRSRLESRPAVEGTASEFVGVVPSDLEAEEALTIKTQKTARGIGSRKSKA
ncbi:conserved hypothetical protein [Ricinus communis]|uniref:Uncharacterized protein n=1 Tax=Ricinus communis TaxID=3988 RepID=B9T611_RICCO|nr:conserved hypothetical protein [Ricinus communis]